MSNADGSVASSNWTMDNEREFIENLVCQRFNFLIAVVAAVIGGVFVADTQTKTLFVLWPGAIVTIGIALTVLRAHAKLDVAIKTLRQDKDHPIAVTTEKAWGFSTRWIVGYALPGMCIVFVVVLLVLAHAGCVLPLK